MLLAVSFLDFLEALLEVPVDLRFVAVVMVVEDSDGYVLAMSLSEATIDRVGRVLNCNYSRNA